MSDFRVLFDEKTEQLVKWLFEVLAPTIRLEAQKIERDLKPQGSKVGTPSAGGDLVEAFEEAEDDFENPRKLKRTDKREFSSNNQGARFGDSKAAAKFGSKRPFD